jgi:hypothetical protein
MLNKIGEWLNVDKLIASFEGYFEARINLIKLEVKEAISELSVKLIFFGVLLIFITSALVCLNIGIALLLNALLASSYAGFFILSLFYFILSVVAYLLSKNENLNQRLKSAIVVKLVNTKETKPEGDETE